MTACPSQLALTRAISEGADAELAAHLERCDACRAAWDGYARAIELARRVPVRVPAPDRREELRTAILAGGATVDAAPPARRPRRGWWIAGAALAAAAALALLLLHPGRHPATRAHGHGTVAPHDGARYAASSTSPDEVVTLHDGSIDVDVTPLHAGERFRVVTADSEIEVRGTAFEVVAQLGHLIGVTVRHGVVEVRPHDAAALVLGAGQAWSAPVRTAIAPPAPPAPAHPEPVPVPEPGPGPVSVATSGRSAATRAATPTEAPPPPDLGDAPAPPTASPTAPPTASIDRQPHELAYDDAWAAMRAGEFARAATAFARTAILDPDGPLVEDADYFGAVALARAERAEATTAFREFLDRYPHSPHRHEASAMLGWILVDANQLTEAEQRFRAALDASSPTVRDSARAGLDALGVR